MRVEFYHIAVEAFKEKPFLGLGLNSSLERFIPHNYVSKAFPPNRKPPFKEVIQGIKDLNIPNTLSTRVLMGDFALGC